MDIIIFLTCLTFGLIMTLIGLRNSIVSAFAIVFNVAFFAVASLPNAVTEQIYNGTQLQNVTYDVFPAVVLPALFVCISVIKVAKYR